MHISYHVSIVSCFGVQNTVIRIYLEGEVFFNITVKFISVLVILAQTIYHTACEIVDIKLTFK